MSRCIGEPMSLIDSRSSLNTITIGNSHNILSFGQIIDADPCSKWPKSRRVETKWSQDVPWSWRSLSAIERDGFASLTSLSDSFRLWQFCSPLFGSFWFVPGFVGIDYVLHILDPCLILGTMA
jgi:hypothetical protein